MKKNRRNGVMEWKLLIWCIERIQDQIQSEDQLLMRQVKLQEFINNMIKTGAIVVQHTSPDPDAEEKRVLAIL